MRLKSTEILAPYYDIVPDTWMIKATAQTIPTWKAFLAPQEPGLCVWGPCIEIPLHHHGYFQLSLQLSLYTDTHHVPSAWPLLDSQRTGWLREIYGYLSFSKTHSSASLVFLLHNWCGGRAVEGGGWGRVGCRLRMERFFHQKRELGAEEQSSWPVTWRPPRFRNSLAGHSSFLLLCALWSSTVQSFTHLEQSYLCWWVVILYF